MSRYLLPKFVITEGHGGRFCSPLDQQGNEPMENIVELATRHGFIGFLSGSKRRLPTFYVHHAESETPMVVHSWVEAERYTLDGCDIIPRDIFLHWYFNYEIPF